MGKHDRGAGPHKENTGLTQTSAALEGIRVADFSHVYQGPVATQLLADFGADVIKIERPGAGDWSRSWGPYVNGVSTAFASLNRNKRSLAVDLRAEGGKAIIRRLLSTSDVLVHNFRPGTMERLGFGYEQIAEKYPRLVYAQSSGWGDRGPYVERGRGGHDVLARAEAAWFEPLGPDGLPVPAGMSADYPAGMLLLQGILIALLARERTGRGQLVSTDLFSAAFHVHAWEGGGLLNRDRVSDQVGIEVTEKVIRKSFRTADSHIEISPVFSPDALRDLSVAMGIGDLSQDPRFATQANRLERADEVNAILSEHFLEDTTDNWIARLEPQGILCGHVNSFSEAAADPQLQANRMVVEMEHPRAGTMRLFGTPVRLYGTPATLRMPPPELGEQNETVLKDLGFSDEEIAEFSAQKVIAR